MDSSAVARRESTAPVAVIGAAEQGELALNIGRFQQTESWLRFVYKRPNAEAAAAYVLWQQCRTAAGGLGLLAAVTALCSLGMAPFGYITRER
jgi:hypothetical protein